MRRRSDSTPYPKSVFSPEFLRYLEDQNEPVTAAEADMAGPWRIEPLPREGGEAGFAVLAPGRSLARGHEPEGVFFRLEHAIEAAVILPTTGRDDLFTLDPTATPRGYAVHSQGELAGYLRWYKTSVTSGMHVTDCLLRTPDSFGRLLRAAGGLALTRIDDLLLERLLGGGMP